MLEPDIEPLPAAAALPLEMFQHEILQQTPDFATWYALVRVDTTMWATCGGFIRVFEEYVARVLGGDITAFDYSNPRHTLRLSTYAPPNVLARLKALPWAAVFRDAAHHHSTVEHTLGGAYVHDELVRALRAEGVAWMHPRPVISHRPQLLVVNIATPRDPASWDEVHERFIRHVISYTELAPMHSSIKAKTTGQSFYVPPREQVVHFCRSRHQVRHHTCIDQDNTVFCEDKLLPHVVHSAMVSVGQLVFDAHWWETGDMCLTPMALYGLMTGTISPVCWHTRAFELQLDRELATCAQGQPQDSDPIYFGSFVYYAAKRIKEQGYIVMCTPPTTKPNVTDRLLAYDMCIHLRR